MQDVLGFVGFVSILVMALAVVCELGYLVGSFLGGLRLQEAHLFGLSVYNRFGIRILPLPQGPWVLYRDRLTPMADLLGYTFYRLPPMLVMGYAGGLMASFRAVTPPLSAIFLAGAAGLLFRIKLNRMTFKGLILLMRRTRETAHGLWRLRAIVIASKYRARDVPQEIIDGLREEPKTAALAHLCDYWRQMERRNGPGARKALLDAWDTKANPHVRSRVCEEMVEFFSTIEPDRSRSDASFAEAPNEFGELVRRYAWEDREKAILDLREYRAQRRREWVKFDASLDRFDSCMARERFDYVSCDEALEEVSRVLARYGPTSVVVTGPWYYIEETYPWMFPELDAS